MIINSANEMIDFGKKISEKHHKILLYGDLGFGKTQFVKGFAQGLGIDSDRVQSPTYTYINNYDDKLLHIDMYRLENEYDFIEKGILDQIQEFDYIAIEWPKFEENFYSKEWIKIKIEKTNENTRKIEIVN